MIPTLASLLQSLRRLFPAAARRPPATLDTKGELARVSVRLEDARARVGILLGSDDPGPSGREPEAERRLVAAEREMMWCLDRRASLLRQDDAGGFARPDTVDGRRGRLLASTMSRVSSAVEPTSSGE